MNPIRRIVSLLFGEIPMIGFVSIVLDDVPIVGGFSRIMLAVWLV